MKTADLRKYHEYAERLECIEKQLERHEVHDVVIGDSGAPAYSKVTKPVEGYIHGMGTVALLTEQSRCEKKMQEIENFIYAIPVTMIRKALIMYCLENNDYTWPEVAEILGYEGDLQKKVARYLVKLGDI